jgi:hypothetical protein
MRNRFFSSSRTKNFLFFHYTCLVFIITLGVISITASGGGGDGDGGTTATPPDAPTGVTAAQKGEAKAIIRWEAVSDAASYNIYWSETAGVTKANGTKISGLTSLEYIQTRLGPGVKYYIVTAVNSAGESNASTAASATVEPFEWSALGEGITDVSGHLYALAVDDDGILYAGGWFTFINADWKAANHIARWDGTSWSALGTGMDREVYALAVYEDGTLYAGGWFEKAGDNYVSYAAKWNGTSWSALAGGTSNAILALDVDSHGDLWVGGAFKDAGGYVVNRVVSFWGDGWWNLGSGVTTEPVVDECMVYAITADDFGTVYAGGYFTIAGGIGANYIARWDALSKTWSSLGSGMSSKVTALALAEDGTLYAGGYFRTAGGVEVNCVARWDGTSWSALGSGMNSIVNALVVDDDGTLYAGGVFNMAGGVAANRIARWDGESWSALGSGTDDYVRCLALDEDGTLYVGGDFITAGGITVNRIARWGL